MVLRPDRNDEFSEVSVIISIFSLSSIVMIHQFIYLYHPLWWSISLYIYLSIQQDRAGRTVSGQVKLAWTKYSLLSRSEDNCSLIDVKPVTGFRHQIRVHLADAIMCPVLGDYKFAGPLFRLNKSLAKKMDLIGSMPGYTRGPLYLHAYQVKIPRKDKESLIINAPFPEYFVKTTVALGLMFPSQFKKLLTEE